MAVEEIETCSREAMGLAVSMGSLGWCIDGGLVASLSFGFWVYRFRGCCGGRPTREWGLWFMWLGLWLEGEAEGSVGGLVP